LFPFPVRPLPAEARRRATAPRLGKDSGQETYITALYADLKVIELSTETDDRLLSTLLVLLLVLFVVVPGIMFIAMALTGHWGTSGWGMMGSWNGGWLWMALVPIAAVIVVVLIIVALASDRSEGAFRRSQQSSVQVYPQYQANWQTNDALSILNRRLAAGEISTEEYNKIRSELTKF